MARFIGAVLGAAHAANSGMPGSLTNPAYHNGRVARLARDLWTGDAAQNDDVELVNLKWDTVLDDLSYIDFGDAGTGVNLDVGFAVAVGGVADVDALVDGQDISTAAGQVKLLKTVAIENRHKPLWQLAGFTSLQAARDATRKNGGLAKLIATFVDANPGAVTLSWAIYGSPQ